MLGNILNRIASMFSGGEKVIFPGDNGEKPKKQVRILVMNMTSENDVNSIRAKMRDYPLIFMNVSRVKGTLKSIVSRLKIIADQFGYRIYGIDPQWLVMTSFEVEKKNQ